MPTLQQLVRNLAEYAIAKKGAEQDEPWRLHDVFEKPHIALPGTAWGSFFDVRQDDRCFAEFPVLAQRLLELQKEYPLIRKADWQERDGHIQMSVPLDAGLPESVLKQLIDEAYAIVWNKLGDHERLKIDLAGMPYVEAKVLDRLMEIHKLKDHRETIRKIVRPATLLLTQKSNEAQIPLGATRIGGRPDLDKNVKWPTYRDGKPLAFLVQINLDELAKVRTPLKGLPSHGLLSVFSVWGWAEDDDLDPHTADDVLESEQENHGWTLVVHTPTTTNLQRFDVPPSVNSFRAAAVELAPILSLPNRAAEPALTALDWNESVAARFETLQSDFRSVQTMHWRSVNHGVASNHQLGGYALFQQDFDHTVVEKGLTMFLQVGSDGNTGMCWGDGGELTFYADPTALQKGRLERVWGTCQGG